MEVKSDIEIAQEAVMENIASVAAKVDISSDDLEMYGKYKAKISDDVFKKLDNKKDAEVVKVASMKSQAAASYDVSVEQDGSVMQYNVLNEDGTASKVE